MHRNLRFIFQFSFFVTLICSSSLKGQNPILEHLTIKEGLPHNSVYAAAQDLSGFMWFGTQSGLVRFDAYNFKTINSVIINSEQEVKIKSVHSLLTDSKGFLWVGTDSDGLLYCNLETGIWHHVFNYETAKARINTIFEDSKGQLWIGTMGNGCFVVDREGNVLRQFSVENSALKDNNIFSFAQTKDGKIWIASAGIGINFSDIQLNLPRNIVPPTLQEGKIQSFRKCLFSDQENRLWIGTEGDGLYILNVEKLQFVHFRKGSKNNIPGNSISDICQTSRGEIWMGSDGGGIIRCLPGMRFDLFQSNPKAEHSLNTNNVLKLYTDRDQHLWICTFNGGLNVIKNNAKNFLSLKEWTKQDVDLSNRSILAICESKNDKIYFATDGTGADVWDKKKKTLSRLSAANVSPNYFTQSVIKTICEDSRGNIWIGYFNKGLDCYNPSSRLIRHFHRVENKPTTISGESIWSIREGKDGKIYIGTIDRGVSIYDYQTDKFTRFLHDPNNPNSLVDNRIFDVLPDGNGNFWVATQNSGLDFYDVSQERFIHFRKGTGEKSLNADDSRCLFFDSKHRLWIGTESGGLHLYCGNGLFRTFTKKDGLLSNSVMSILEDRQHNLWVSGFQGISRIEPEEGKINNYDFHVPQSSNQFNQNAGAIFSDGTICFGGINGMTFFNPITILSDNKAADVHFSEFRIFNTSVAPNDVTGILQKSLDNTESVTLQYDQYPFSLEFSSLNYADPYNSDFAYMMEGIDNHWHTMVKGARNISFNSLNPGTYVLKVKASNSNGIWSNQIRTLEIIVLPPFWKTWWFRLLLTILFITLMIRAIQLYNQRREEKWQIRLVEREKTILSLQNEKLARENESKSSELMSKAMQIGHKTEVMQSLKEGLESLRIGQSDLIVKKIRSLENIVDKELHDEDNWKQLAMYFDQVNHHFTEKLLSTYPHLTQNDLRICILIKLNLSIKEMAALLNVSIQGIEKSKYRLKKRLHLSTEDDLTEFLRTFAQ